MRKLAVCAALLVAMPAHAEDFHLLCMGSGAAVKQRGVSAYGFNNSGGSAWAQGLASTDVAFQDQVNIDIENGVGKIRMPRSMLPRIRGGKEGWFDFEDLKIGDKEITGNAGVSFINSPKVRIDRMTGAISISGKSGDFAGQCQPYDPTSAKRAF